MTESIHVILTGGLGNQLFQLSAGLSLLNDVPVNLVLDSGLGRPRRNENGFPEIESFYFGHEIHFSNLNKNPRFIRKVNGYLLRMGIVHKWYESWNWTRKIINSIGKLILRQYFNENLEVISASGLGYSKIQTKGKSVSLNGYFQSYRYLNEGISHEVLDQMQVKIESKELIEFKALASIEKPLIVHFRFGDYEKEPLFGIPNSEYYEVALGRAIQELHIHNIWVFSDDLEKAKRKIPKDLNVSIRWIDSIANSTSQTFELMRYGNHYILANSSFSYWAAILTKNRNAKVWAPWPWFEKMDSPQDLLPPHWVTINPWDFKNVLSS